MHLAYPLPILTDDIISYREDGGVLLFPQVLLLFRSRIPLAINDIRRHGGHWIERRNRKPIGPEQAARRVVEEQRSVFRWCRQILAFLKTRQTFHLLGG